MINIEKIKENIKCPQFGDLEYGKWGALRLEQRIAYKELIEEIERLNNELELQNIEMGREIERLQEELKYSISIVEHNKTIQSNINSYNKLSNYSSDLEDRIDKAIEYIEENSDDMHTYISQAITQILKGSDKE